MKSEVHSMRCGSLARHQTFGWALKRFDFEILRNAPKWVRFFDGIIKSLVDLFYFNSPDCLAEIVALSIESVFVL